MLPSNADQFCALVEEVIAPLFKNPLNMCKFPECISEGLFALLVLGLKPSVFRHHEASS